MLNLVSYLYISIRAFWKIFFQGCFAANPALLLVHHTRVRVGVSELYKITPKITRKTQKSLEIGPHQATTRRLDLLS